MSIKYYYICNVFLSKIVIMQAISKYITTDIYIYAVDIFDQILNLQL